MTTLAIIRLLAQVIGEIVPPYLPIPWTVGTEHETYPGERLALSELASIVHDEVVYADRWAIVDWIRREMHAATPQQVMDLIDRAAAALPRASTMEIAAKCSQRLESLRSRSQELVWEQSQRAERASKAIGALHAMVRATDRDCTNTSRPSARWPAGSRER